MLLIMLLIETILCFNLACPDLLTIYFMCMHFILLVQEVSFFKFVLELFCLLSIYRVSVKKNVDFLRDF